MYIKINVYTKDIYDIYIYNINIIYIYDIYMTYIYIYNINIIYTNIYALYICIRVFVCVAFLMIKFCL